MYGQSFVKKDSSEIVPFLYKVYYQTDLDSAKKLEDRLYFNHRIQNVGSFQNFMGLTGTIGSSLVPVLYESQFYTNIKLGRTLNDAYFYTPQSIPYFALNKPISELDFTFFGNGNEEFNGFLAQNLSRHIHLSVGIRRTNNKGYFLNQENTHNNVYLYLVHDKGRLRTNLEFVLNDMNLRESGGYQPDIFQSGLAPSRWLAASPTLATAKNQIKNYQVNFRYRYLIAGLDSIKDSLLFIPKKASLYIDHQLQRFSDRQFYSDTVNSTSMLSYGVLASNMSNQLNTSYLHSGLQSDFRLNYTVRNLKVSAYNILGTNSIDIGQQFGQYLKNYEYVNVGLGLDIAYQWHSNWKFIGKGYKSFLGYTENDFRLAAEIQASYNSTQLRSWAIYSHQKPPFVSSYQFTASFDNFYFLNTQKTLETGFGFNFQKLKLSGKFQYFAIEDFQTFDTMLRPIQLQNNFLQLYIKKEWSYKWLYFPTEVYFQNSIFQRGMLRQTLAIKNRLFSDKNNFLVGAELSLNYQYAEARYGSYFMQSVWTENLPEAPIFPKLDLFATFKISKVHLSLIFDNFLSSYMQSGISYMQYHPITPSAFYLRMNWRFLE